MVKVQTTYRLIGRDKLAEELGVSRHHLTCVFQGLRRSARLEAELEKRGIKCRKWRSPKAQA